MPILRANRVRDPASHRRDSCRGGSRARWSINGAGSTGSRRRGEIGCTEHGATPRHYIGADELACGPGVERVRVGAKKGFEGLGRSVFDDDERKRTGDDGGVVVERRSEHGYAKRRHPPCAANQARRRSMARVARVYPQSVLSFPDNHG